MIFESIRQFFWHSFAYICLFLLGWLFVELTFSIYPSILFAFLISNKEPHQVLWWTPSLMWVFFCLFVSLKILFWRIQEWVWEFLILCSLGTSSHFVTDKLHFYLPSSCLFYYRNSVVSLGYVIHLLAISFSK